MDAETGHTPFVHRSPAQRRALAALGIEDWVRRDVVGADTGEAARASAAPPAGPASSASQGNAPGAPAMGATVHGAAPPAAMAPTGDTGAESPVDAVFDAAEAPPRPSVDRLADARALLAAGDPPQAPRPQTPTSEAAQPPVTAPAVPSEALPAPATEAASAEQGAAATAATTITTTTTTTTSTTTAATTADAEASPTSQAPTPEVGGDDGPPPHFRLQALVGGDGLLLIDGTLALERTELRRLADLLRAAIAVRRGSSEGVAIRSQQFSWPQLDAANVDQGPARAREAVAAWVLRSTGDGDGVVVVVDAPTPDADVVAAYAALETLPLRRIRLPVSVLTEPGEASGRDAWSRFAALGAGGP